MKKRVVALLLSVTMCSASVIGAGASEMTDESITLSAETAEETAPEEPAAEEPSAEEPEKPVVEEPAIEESEEPAIEEPVIEEPEEPAVEEPVIEEPAAEEPVEEPVSEELFADEEAFEGGFLDASAVEEASEEIQMDEDSFETVALYGMLLKAYEVEEEDWKTEGEKIRLVKPQPEVPAADDSAEDAQTVEAAEEETSALAEGQEPEAAEESVPETLTADAPEEYFTAEDGLVLIKTVADGVGHEQVYLFDEQGNLVTGESADVTDSQGAVSTYYFVGEEEAVLYADYAGPSELAGPWNTNEGSLLVNEIVWTGTAFEYYGADGKKVPMASSPYLTEKGYYEISYKGGKTFRYHLNAEGVPQTGTAVLNEKEYYFDSAKNASDIPGSMHFKWLYEKEDGKERWRYYGSSTGTRQHAEIWATKLDSSLNPSVGTYKYLLDKNGYVLKSTVKKAANGNTYGTNSAGRIYINKVASIGGTWYYFGKDGKLTGNKLVKVGSYRYYFGSNGKRVTWTNRWVACPGANNRLYYFGKVAGRVEEKKGFQKITTKDGTYVGWAFFGSNGNCFQNVSVNDYYFKSNGIMASGLTKINNKYYFYTVSSSSACRGKLVKGKMVSYDGKMYLAASTGQLYRSQWGKYNGNYYYFQANCAAAKNTYQKLGNTWGMCDKAGKFVTGWYVFSNSKNRVGYLNPNAKGFYKNTIVTIDGKQYRFDSTGYRVNDRSSEIKRSKYYLEVDKGNGVMTVYTDSSKSIPVRSIRVSVGLPSTPTPNGTFTMHRSLRWQPLMGPSWGQYGTHVVAGIYVHSVAGGAQSSYSLPAGEYDRLGSPASHGCIRACVADAKWVFENCDGSTIRIFTGDNISDDALKGPLGKPPITPRRGSGNFDPTDPEVP